MPTKPLAALAVSLALTVPVAAHEFWIEPLDFAVEDGARIEAHNRVGEMLKGNSDPYVPASFTRFEVIDAEGPRTVEGRLGDRPALGIEPRVPGLHIAVYRTRAYFLTYSEEGKFASFLKAEGLDRVLEAHAARDLPAAGFKEAYTRFAKALVAVGGGEGADAPVGLRVELVALTNPYTDAGPVEVEARFEGAPLADVQVAAFRRDGSGAVTREVYRTDADGRVTVPRDGAETTLLSAVHMVEAEGDLAEKRGAAWHSLWASLTYGAAL